MSGHSGGSSGRGDAEHDGPERPRPLPSRSRALLWLHERLFSTLGNTLLSLVLLALIGWLVWTLGKWLLVSADFDVIRTNRRLLLVGRFPLGEEWRIWPIFYGLVVAIGWSWGSWTRATSVAAATLALIGVLVLPVIAGTSGTLDAAPAFGAGVGAYLVAQRWAGTRRGQRRARIVGMGMWVILLPAVIVLLQVRGGVDPALWGGLYLNLIVASGAAIGALPFGILLALARSSSFRVLRDGVCGTHARAAATGDAHPGMARTPALPACLAARTASRWSTGSQSPSGCSPQRSSRRRSAAASVRSLEVSTRQRPRSA